MDWPFLRLAGREIYMLFIPLKKIVSNLIREVFLKTNTHLTFSLNKFIKILWKILRVISQLFFFLLHPHILVSLPFSLNNNYYQRSLTAPLHMALKTGVWIWRNLLTQCHFISKSQDLSMIRSWVMAKLTHCEGCLGKSEYFCLDRMNLVILR